MTYPQHKDTTIFWNWDQLRLWLVNNHNIARPEDAADLPQIYEQLGVVAYAPPTPEPVPPYIPTSVTMRQARLQLLVMGVYSTINGAVATMSEAAQIEWEYAVTVDRENTLTQQMIAMLGWTEADADAYFTAASLL